VRISKRFSLTHTQAELDFVDIDTNRDMPLFVDPHFLAQRTDPWSVGATVVDPIFWTEKRPFLRWWAALKIEESQCPKPARVTHPA
jgi:hypothetical protein